VNVTDADPMVRTTWEVSETGPQSTTYAHEFGHILGLDDAYKDVPDPADPSQKTSEPLPGAPLDLMSIANEPSIDQSTINRLVKRHGDVLDLSKLAGCPDTTLYYHVIAATGSGTASAVGGPAPCVTMSSASGPWTTTFRETPGRTIDGTVSIDRDGNTLGAFSVTGDENWPSLTVRKVGKDCPPPSVYPAQVFPGHGPLSLFLEGDASWVTLRWRGFRMHYVLTVGEGGGGGFGSNSGQYCVPDDKLGAESRTIPGGDIHLTQVPFSIFLVTEPFVLTFDKSYSLRGSPQIDGTCQNSEQYSITLQRVNEDGSGPVSVVPAPWPPTSPPPAPPTVPPSVPPTAPPTAPPTPHPLKITWCATPAPGQLSTPTPCPSPDCTMQAAPGVNWSGCYLSDVNLAGAKLAGANLEGAAFFNVDLRGADLTGAWLVDAQLGGANLAGAQLAGANLEHAGLDLANLSDADLTDAWLARANLDGINLSGARLVRAYLGGANLAEANLAGANLANADLTEANLFGSTGVPSSVSGVKYLGTGCPDRTYSDDDGGTCVGHGW
jgi:hypothetical protein